MHLVQLCWFSVFQPSFCAASRSVYACFISHQLTAEESPRFLMYSQVKSHLEGSVIDECYQGECSFHQGKMFYIFSVLSLRWAALRRKPSTQFRLSSWSLLFVSHPGYLWRFVGATVAFIHWNLVWREVRYLGSLHRWPCNSKVVPVLLGWKHEGLYLEFPSALWPPPFPTEP